jgi:hypothetical protein
MIRYGVSRDVLVRHPMRVAGLCNVKFVFRGLRRSLVWRGLRCDGLQLLMVVEVMYSDCSWFE